MKVVAISASFTQKQVINFKQYSSYLYNANQKSMSVKQFIVTTKKRTSLKPFLEVFQAKCKGEVASNYLVQIYNLSKFEDQKIKEALQFNRCIFSDQFQFSTSNIVKISKAEETDSFCAIYVQKYDKNLDQYIKERKKGRVPEEACIKIMEDILKGLATILEAGYRPVSIRADNVVRYFSKNPEQRDEIWKIKNVVYSSNLSFDQQHFLTFQQNYSPPEIYSRRNIKDFEYQQTEQYTNALLVWSLGIIMSKLLGIQSKLDSKKKLSQFRDRQFNVMDILYIRNQYSVQFLKVVSSMLHFDNKKRMKLRDLFNQPIFSAELKKRVNKSVIKIQQIKKAVQEWKVECSFFPFRKIF